jgi:hypothetical protein
MVLYRATKDGNIPLSAEEEAKIRADWEAEDKKVKVETKCLEDRVKDLEKAVALLSK